MSRKQLAFFISMASSEVSIEAPVKRDRDDVADDDVADDANVEKDALDSGNIPGEGVPMHPETEDPDYVLRLYSLKCPRETEPDSQKAKLRLPMVSKLCKILAVPVDRAFVPSNVRVFSAEIIAAEVEDAIQQFAISPSDGKVGLQTYRDAFMRVSQALMHKDHALLRAKVLCGAVAPGTLPRMTKAQLTPPSVAAQREAYQKKLAESTLVIPAGGWTLDESVVCGGCKLAGSVYFKQIQMRSSDEPPTSFYHCRACGKRARHGG